MGCRIYFVRHGQSLGNLSATYLGHTDLDLSPLGYMQAECTAKHLSKVKFDKIFSSDLIRAVHTAEPLAALKGLKVIINRNLREIYAGKWENKTFDALALEYPESYRKWRNDIGNAVPDGGESVAELQKRITAESKKIAEENDGKTVAVFTHATAIRSFFCKAYGLSISEMKNIPWAANASVSVAEYNNGRFSVVNYGEEVFLESLKTELPPNV